MADAHDGGCLAGVQQLEQPVLQDLASAFSAYVGSLAGWVSAGLAASPPDIGKDWQEAFASMVLSLPAEEFPVIAANREYLAGSVFTLRWHGGAERPLDASFEAAVEMWIDGLAAPLERPAHALPAVRPRAQYCAMFKTVAAESRDSHAWDMYAAERADIHAFLASLTPAQWNEPSLCEGWRVRDVAVHLLADEPIEQLGVVRSFARAATFKFSVHRINQWWITRNRERPVPEIVAAFDGPWRPGKISKMLGPVTAIRAGVIHHQDMRRALGIPRVVPEERVRAALDVVLTPRGSRNLGSCQRAAGLRLHADDIDWSWGSGPEVTGPAEAILMAVVGRPAALADLSGEGLPVLAGRVPQPRAAG